MSALIVQLTDEQLDDLADRIAKRVRQPEPLTYAEAAEQLRISERSVARMVEDGTLQRLPGTHRRLISHHEIQRHLQAK